MNCRFSIPTQKKNLLLFVEHAFLYCQKFSRLFHDESLAQAFGETEDEDDLFAGFPHLAVGVAEEDAVAAAAIDGIGVEEAGAVVEGHHATLLAGTAAVGHDEVVLLEGAGIDVDTAVLVEDRLGLDADVVCKDFLCFIHFN